VVGLTGLSDHDRPRPRDVPGFAEAVAAGLVPDRPATAPEPTVHPSAAARQRVFVVALVGGITGTVLVGLRSLGDDPGRGAVVVAGLSATAVLVVLAALWRWVGAAALAELHRGYTTTTLVFGGYGLSVPRRYRSFGDRPPWDYSGVWRVGPVASAEAPDPAQDPPGFYPSPTRDGELELWSGRVWLGVFRPSGLRGPGQA
jgi:hypothetical protein